MIAPAQPNPPRIAVAEDDPSARAMLRAWLHTEGCVGDIFGDVASARVGLAAQQYDLLISDIHLPDGTGQELAAMIGEPNVGLPVIFLTGEPSLETAMRSVRLRAVAYLVKPPDLDELRLVLHREVAAHRHRRALTSSRNHLAEWDRELARLEQATPTPESRPVVDYLQVTVRHLGTVLGELDRSVSMLGTDSAGRDIVTQIDLLTSLRQTVSVLERTREHFKSKDLGELRKDLEMLLRRIDGPAEK